MITWLQVVSEIQRILNLGPGKYSVKCLKNGTIIKINVPPNFVFNCAKLRALDNLATPNQKKITGCCADFSSKQVFFLVGNVKMQTFKTKHNDIEFCADEAVDGDCVEYLLDLSNTHPIIPIIEVDELDDRVSRITSSGPLLYFCEKNNVEYNLSFDFESNTAFIDVPRRRKRQKTSHNAL